MCWLGAYRYLKQFKSPQINADRHGANDGKRKIILENFNQPVGSESALIASVRTHKPAIWEAATLTIRPVKISVMNSAPMRSSRATLVDMFKQSATTNGAASGVV
ncbi:MAG TPA: hypothetical protein VFZ40_16595 [Pyrinomonadaceae bacterium]